MWKFKPILKTTIWGGDRILPLKGIESDLSNVGECWEISGIPGSESVVESGPDAGMRLAELIDKYDASLLGERIYKKYGNKFPLLVKLINSSQDLSVQVHPGDEHANEQGYPYGKDEMWYVAETGTGARIANGFLHAVDPEEYDSLVESGRIEDVLKYIDIMPGEIYYIPAGRVHAICGDCLIIEIQQASDLTYRIYDYNRTDKDGKPRELHKDLARKAINFTDIDCAQQPYAQRDNLPVNVIKSPYFCVNLLKVNTEVMRDYSENDTFVILICIDGKADITCGDSTLSLSKGHSVLIPASALGIIINPDEKASLIETYIN